MRPIGKRKFRNFLLDPKTQLFYGFIIFSGLLLCLGYFQGSQLFTLSDIIMKLSSQVDLDKDFAAEIFNSLRVTWIVFTLSIITTWIFSLLVGIYLTHRFLGPSIRIKKMIEQLKSGNYSAREELRKNDEMQDIMEDLHQLADILEKKYSTDHTKSNAD